MGPKIGYPLWMAPQGENYCTAYQIWVSVGPVVVKRAML